MGIDQVRAGCIGRPAIRTVQLSIRTAVWDELEDAVAEMEFKGETLTVPKLCCEILEAWAAERRMIPVARAGG